MKSVVTKTTEFLRLFKDNLAREYESNPTLQKELRDLRRTALRVREAAGPVLSGPARACSSFYRGMQFADFLLGRFFKSVFDCGDQKIDRKDSALDFFVERTFQIPQFYGGVRSRFLGDARGGPALPSQNKMLAGGLGARLGALLSLKVQGLSRAWTGCRVYRDFEVLSRIENETLPEIMTSLFQYKILENTTHEAAESLKKMRSELAQGAKISLVDIRQTCIEEVCIKNLKKLVRCSFEFTVEVCARPGRDHGPAERHFGGVIEFVKNDKGAWVAGSFSHEAL